MNNKMQKKLLDNVEKFIEDGFMTDEAIFTKAAIAEIENEFNRLSLLSEANAINGNINSAIISLNFFLKKVQENLKEKVNKIAGEVENDVKATKNNYIPNDAIFFAATHEEFEVLKHLPINNEANAKNGYHILKPIWDEIKELIESDKNASKELEIFVGNDIEAFVKWFDKEKSKIEKTKVKSSTSKQFRIIESHFGVIDKIFNLRKKEAPFKNYALIDSFSNKSDAYVAAILKNVIIANEANAVSLEKHFERLSNISINTINTNINSKIDNAYTGTLKKFLIAIASIEESIKDIEKANSFDEVQKNLHKLIDSIEISKSKTTLISVLDLENKKDNKKEFFEISEELLMI